ncbi:hypothetical protein AAVH_27326 [Aphelenchoides avenae]|nr:hypothetical protein AAVH_27326 [Aphelenchus avenae]
MSSPSTDADQPTHHAQVEARRSRSDRPAPVPDQVHEQLRQYAEHLRDKLEEELTRAQIASSVIETLRQEDHGECNRRVDYLQLQLRYKDIELQNELTRVDLFAKTIKDLREALPKRGTKSTASVATGTVHSVTSTSCQTTNADAYQDHTQCVQRVSELEARLAHQGTVRHVKHGVRQAVEACPAQLSIVSCLYNGGSSVVKYVQRKCHSTTTSVTGMSPSSKRYKLSFASVYSDHVVIIVKLAPPKQA